MEGKVRLTGEEAKELTDYIERLAATRLGNGAMELDASFYAGAMAVIHYLTEGRSSPELSNGVPPSWVFNILSGRSPSVKHMGDEKAQQEFQARFDRAARLIQNKEQMYEFVCGMFERDRDYRDYYDRYIPHVVLARVILEDIGLYDFRDEEE